MASQKVTGITAAKALHHSRIQEVMFDDFFGKKLSNEGFTIEQVAGEYRISSAPTEGHHPALDDPSRRIVETLCNGQNHTPLAGR